MTTATASQTSTGLKLSQETLGVLKNFASLNSNILVRPGSTLSTVTPVKNVMAEATVEETFDTEFGIWDLNKFLGVQMQLERMHHLFITSIVNQVS